MKKKTKVKERQMPTPKLTKNDPGFTGPHFFLSLPLCLLKLDMYRFRLAAARKGLFLLLFLMSYRWFGVQRHPVEAYLHGSPSEA